MTTTTNPKNAGRKRLQAEKRKDRKYTVTDEVHEGLKKLGNGSASQAISDLYYEKIEGVPIGVKSHLSAGKTD